MKIFDYKCLWCGRPAKFPGECSNCMFGKFVSDFILKVALPIIAVLIVISIAVELMS